MSVAAPLRFLIVEDHGFQRWMLENTLRSLGATQIDSAGDGQAALEMLESGARRVDVIITDLDMPGMDGLAFIRHLGEARSDAGLIVSSSLERSVIASVEVMAQVYGVRLLGAVDKPVNAARLSQALLRQREGRAARSPTLVPCTLADIRRGLAAGEFVPYFQPKVQLPDRRLLGAEALARWLHPDRGMVAPQQFVPPLEAANALDSLNAQMLQSSLAACARWRAAGLETSVAVNLSLLSLDDLALAELLVELVEANRLEPRHLVLELTETAEAHDPGRALENLARLRMRGFGLSIDDYGMGYSSMQQLTRIAFSELKIDRGFVRRASSHASDRAMIEASLEVAAKLGIRAVAEGVETQGEWGMLAKLGCPAAQGYYIAPPMPEVDFVAWARASA